MTADKARSSSPTRRNVTENSSDRVHSVREGFGRGEKVRAVAQVASVALWNTRGRRSRTRGEDTSGIRVTRCSQIRVKQANTSGQRLHEYRSRSIFSCRLATQRDQWTDLQHACVTQRVSSCLQTRRSREPLMATSTSHKL